MKKEKKHGVSMAGRKAMMGYLFTLPFALGFILFFLSPMILYLVMGFSYIRLSDNGMNFSFAALDNFNEILFVQQGFMAKIIASLKSLTITFPSIVLYSFFIATLLNQKFRGRSLFRTIFFMPVLIASGVAAVTNSDNTMMLAINALSGMGDKTDTLNLADSLLSLFGNSFNSTFTSLVMQIVSQIYIITLNSGVQILIFIAGLQTITPSIYEASRIDGATAWQDFWKITLPLISPMILVNSIYTIIDQLSGENNSLMNMIYETTITNNKYALGSAMGIIYFALILSVLGLVIFTMSKVVYYEDR